MRRKIYIVSGPTAGGKSDLAIRMARSLNASVINADSMQIYRDLKVLSARPSEAETAGIPHLLYGYADAFYESSVQDWLNKAVKVVESVPQAVFVGGTGMYIGAMVKGLSPIPDVDLNVRETVRQMPIEEVKSKVHDCPFTDSQRLRRALEVELSTGKTLSYFQQLPKIKPIDADFEVFFVNPPREILYERCNQRFIQMLESGAIEEVKYLIQLNATGGVTKAIGVPEITDYLVGQISREEMIVRAQLATRHYAKRHITWFKHQLPNIIEIQNPTAFTLKA